MQAISVANVSDCHRRRNCNFLMIFTPTRHGNESSSASMTVAT